MRGSSDERRSNGPVDERATRPRLHHPIRGARAAGATIHPNTGLTHRAHGRSMNDLSAPGGGLQPLFVSDPTRATTSATLASRDAALPSTVGLSQQGGTGMPRQPVDLASHLNQTVTLTITVPVLHGDPTLRGPLNTFGARRNLPPATSATAAAPGVGRFAPTSGAPPARTLRRPRGCP